MRNLLLPLVAVCSMLIFGSCLKSDDNKPNYQMMFQRQLSEDEISIARFVASNSINATKHETGIYFEVKNKGNGSYNYEKQNPLIKVKYTGRLLNGEIFGSSKNQEEWFRLGDTILGWQIGIQLIQKGGKIRLIIPSGYAYGDVAKGVIPANSILDFDIELIDIK